MQRPEPTATLPATPERIEVFRHRALLGLALFHSADRQPGDRDVIPIRKPPGPPPGRQPLKPGSWPARVLGILQAAGEPLRAVDVRKIARVSQGRYTTIYWALGELVKRDLVERQGRLYAAGR